MKEKTYTESAFDQIFQNKDKIEYNFDIKSGKFSKRDIKIIKYLNFITKLFSIQVLIPS